MSWDVLILPFQFSFMLDAFLLAAIISVPAALLSCFLVVKGWALIGDAEYLFARVNFRTKSVPFKHI